ncbi:MAG: hypothetical protein U0871_08430 [Gemmataceae bacterium]
MNRRTFLTVSAAAVGGAGFAQPPAKRKRIAAVNTVFFRMSHAYHIVGRLLHGYSVQGRHHTPPFTVPRMYTAQYPANDVSRAMAKKFNVGVTDSVAAALGGKGSLDVDGVLLIGEHGQYPRNALGQIQYPRYELFQEIVEVFKASGRSVPVFNDKHLSYDHAKAKEMVETARRMGFAFMAGSSLPVTFRRPEWEPEYGAKIEEAVVCYYADFDVYGFHALEVLQSVMERRRGGETGVKSVRTLKGPAVWEAWDKGEWSKDLAEACLRKSSTRDFGRPRDHVENPSAMLVEYADGARATVLNMSGYVSDLTCAVKLAGDPKPQGALFYLPAPPGARFFDALTYYIEELFATGKSPYPVERTLLTSTVLDFAHRSAAEGGKMMTDPALGVTYMAPNRSFFFRGLPSDDNR